MYWLLMYSYKWLHGLDLSGFDSLITFSIQVLHFNKKLICPRIKMDTIYKSKHRDIK